MNIHCNEYKRIVVWKTSLYDRSYASISWNVLIIIIIIIMYIYLFLSWVVWQKTAVDYFAPCTLIITNRNRFYCTHFIQTWIRFLSKHSSVCSTNNSLGRRDSWHSISLGDNIVVQNNYSHKEYKISFCYQKAFFSLYLFWNKNICLKDYTVTYSTLLHNKFFWNNRDTL